MLYRLASDGPAQTGSFRYCIFLVSDSCRYDEFITSNIKGDRRPNTNNKLSLFFYWPSIGNLASVVHPTPASTYGHSAKGLRPVMAVAEALRGHPTRHGDPSPLSRSHMPATRTRGAPGRRRVLDWTAAGDDFARTPRVSRNRSRRGRLNAAEPAARPYLWDSAPGGRRRDAPMPRPGVARLLPGGR